MTPDEEWRAVPGYEGSYEISSFGRLRSLDRLDSRGWRVKGRMIKMAVVGRGYQQVALSAHGKQRNTLIHRLVLLTFVGEPPIGTEACHYDGNGLNNNVDNLRWDTKSGNIRDAIRHGTHSETRKTHCPSGHAYEGVNLYIRPSSGARRCRECHRGHGRRYYRESKARTSEGEDAT